MSSSSVSQRLGQEDITPIESSCFLFGRTRLRERSGMTPQPTVQDEAKNSDDPTADGVQGDYADQQESEHDEWCAALPVAVSPCERNSQDADGKRTREDHSAELGEPKPVTEPSPIASDSRHVFSLGRGTERRARSAAAVGGELSARSITRQSDRTSVSSCFGFGLRVPHALQRGGQLLRARATGVTRVAIGPQRRRLRSKLTFSGSRWAKNSVSPRSIEATRSISSSVSSKSKTSMFSRIRSGRTDF
jgi:hypothetical protein